ncbi:MAG: di-heme enzyme [Bradymonadaceae bacterium]|nr:di-heme enzyme [Lujinxingiaceae bacterium]
MNRRRRSAFFAAASTLIALLVLTTATGCTEGEPASEPEPYVWKLPAGFPVPNVPADSPMSEAAVELGRHLFYDTRMSANQSFSCASCHRQELAFTDGLARSEGSTGEVHPRGAMSLTNVAYNAAFNWANPLIGGLEAQALLPMFGETPVELGLAGKEDELFARLRAAPDYPAMFARAYPPSAGEDPVNLANLVRALGAFQRTLISGNSAFDRAIYADPPEALSESAARGMELFFSERLECFHCHGGFNFSDSVDHQGQVLAEMSFHNTGLYNYDFLGAYPADNTGIHEFSGRAEDMGRFKAPTLRNIALTAPYMHDGSIASLSEVLDHYAVGGRTLASGPYAGDGSRSPLKSAFLVGFSLSDQEKADVLNFLEALSDEEFVSTPRFASPF